MAVKQSKLPLEGLSFMCCLLCCAALCCAVQRCAVHCCAVHSIMPNGVVVWIGSLDITDSMLHDKALIT